MFSGYGRDNNVSQSCLSAWLGPLLLEVSAVRQADGLLQVSALLPHLLRATRHHQVRLLLEVPRVSGDRGSAQEVTFWHSPISETALFIGSLSCRLRRNGVSVDLLSQLLSFALDRMKHVRGVSE